MSFEINLNDKSDYSLSFTVESGEVQWYLGGIKKYNEGINESLKSLLPKKKIFTINSLIYKVETQKKEMNLSFNCSYNDETNSLSIILDESINHKNLTKEVALTLFLFVDKVQIEKFYLIVALKNPN